MSEQLRMRDLVERTGASREAIRFYINEGLLPEPLKTSRNMAWYSEEHVERIRYIKALQEEHYLPLKAIRNVLNGVDEGEFTAHQRHQFTVLRQRLRADHARDPRAPLSRLRDELALTDEEVQAAEAMGFVDAAGNVDTDGTELLRVWAQARAEGLTPERGFGPRDLQIVQDAVDLLFARELQLFTERLGDMDDEEVVHILDRILPAVDRVFAILHARRVREFLEQTDTDEASAQETRQ